MSQFRPSGYNFLPDAVKNLLIINGLFFLATYALGAAFGIDLVRLLGMYFIGTEEFEPYQIVTHLFMHGSLMHIFSNMFALWMFGSILENVWGAKRFLIYYFFTGLGAAILHMAVTYFEINSLENDLQAFLEAGTYEAFNHFVNEHIQDYARFLKQDYINQINQISSAWASEPNNPVYVSRARELFQSFIDLKASIPTVGASGAVFGVLLAFGMLFPNTRIYLYFLFPVKAKYFVIFYGLFELWAGFQSRPGDNVAHFAHIGGMLFGFILIKIWNKKNRQDFY